MFFTKTLQTNLQSTIFDLAALTLPSIGIFINLIFLMMNRLQWLCLESLKGCLNSTPFDKDNSNVVVNTLNSWCQS